MNGNRLVATGVVLMVVTVPSPAHADNVRDRQWHLSSLGITAAQRTSAGAGSVVAVVDTGVDRHSDLVSNLLAGADFSAPDGGTGQIDQDGHGTAMASLIAGHGHGPNDGALGIAPRAKVLPVRVAASDGLDRDELAEGIEWAADHGSQVINLSVDTADSPALKRAIQHAMDRDVVVVAAVGLPGGLGKIPPPARYPGVVAVSGVDQAGNLTASQLGPEVAVAAPAKDIVHATKDGGYSIGTGTSDATAIVSGVVALIRARYPDMDAANVINRLISTADDKGPPGRDTGYGFGVVNPVRALTADVPPVATNPLLARAAPVMSASPVPASDAPNPGDTGQAASEQPGSAWFWLAIALGVLAAIAVLAGFIFITRRARPRADGRSYP